jgi:hypothetical protein
MNMIKLNDLFGLPAAKDMDDDAYIQLIHASWGEGKLPIFWEDGPVPPYLAPFFALTFFNTGSLIKILIGEDKKRFLPDILLPPGPWHQNGRDYFNPIFFGPEQVVALFGSKLEASKNPVGRPSAREPILEIYNRRLAAGETQEVLAEEAEVIGRRLKRDYPGAPNAEQTTIENNIRDLHRKKFPRR